MMYRSYHASSSTGEGSGQLRKRRTRHSRRAEAPGTSEAADAQDRPGRLQKTALVTAVDILARQEQSEQKLREKLLRKGYEADDIDAAVQRLKERHYLNDEEACARQFRFLYEESRNSVRQICLKLIQRGFDKELVMGCVPRDTYEREKDAALRVLALKSRAADRQKLVASLFRKGFDVRASRAAVEAYLTDSPEDV